MTHSYSCQDTIFSHIIACSSLQYVLYDINVRQDLQVAGIVVMETIFEYIMIGIRHCNWRGIAKWLKRIPGSPVCLFRCPRGYGTLWSVVGHMSRGRAHPGSQVYYHPVI